MGGRMNQLVSFVKGTFHLNDINKIFMLDIANVMNLCNFLSLFHPAVCNCNMLCCIINVPTTVYLYISGLILDKQMFISRHVAGDELIISAEPETAFTS